MSRRNRSYTPLPLGSCMAVAGQLYFTKRNNISAEDFIVVLVKSNTKQSSVWGVKGWHWGSQVESLSRNVIAFWQQCSLAEQHSTFYSLVPRETWREGLSSSPSTRHGGAWGERRYSSYSFTTSALDGGEWSASRPCRALPPGKGPPVPIVGLQEAGCLQ
jgi:hypothetical protein